MRQTQAAPLLTLEEAARRLPARVHQSTVRKWAVTGLHGVRLRVTRVGARVYVTERALAEFQHSVDEAIVAGGAST